jgi:hypothetical protein
MKSTNCVEESTLNGLFAAAPGSCLLLNVSSVLPCLWSWTMILTVSDRLLRMVQKERTLDIVKESILP